MAWFHLFYDKWVRRLCLGMYTKQKALTPPNSACILLWKVWNKLIHPVYKPSCASSAGKLDFPFLSNRIAPMDYFITHLLPSNAVLACCFCQSQIRVAITYWVLIISSPCKSGTLPLFLFLCEFSSFRSIYRYSNLKIYWQAGNYYPLFCQLFLWIINELFANKSQIWKYNCRESPHHNCKKLITAIIFIYFKKLDWGLRY